MPVVWTEAEDAFSRWTPRRAATLKRDGLRLHVDVSGRQGSATHAPEGLYVEIEDGPLAYYSRTEVANGDEVFAVLDELVDRLAEHRFV